MVDKKPVVKYEYRYEIACGGAGETCGFALKTCEYRGQQGPLTHVWRRVVGATAWIQQPDMCYDQIEATAPAGSSVPPPPPVPTFAQIQQAFAELPFAKPTVRIQPEGTTTLVNLPTYYRAEWPQADLAPGDISAPVQLLSWRVEFKIDPARYRYTYGDGRASGWTTSTGGTYPDGGITHTYTAPVTAQVRADAQLTGRYRVNGGPWEDIETTADLQNEPTTTITVREAEARLVAPTS